MCENRLHMLLLHSSVFHIVQAKEANVGCRHVDLVLAHVTTDLLQYIETKKRTSPE